MVYTEVGWSSCCLRKAFPIRHVRLCSPNMSLIYRFVSPKYRTLHLLHDWIICTGSMRRTGQWGEKCVRGMFGRYHLVPSMMDCGREKKTDD